MQDKIIDFIKRNRVSSTQIADCLNKSGGVIGANAINRGHFRVGKINWVYAVNGTNYDVHEQIQRTQDNDIVYVDVHNHLDKAVFGDLVSKYLLLYKQASAIVTNGLLRDAPMLIKENWAIWCSGFTPVGYVNHQLTTPDDVQNTIEHRRVMFDGAIAVCDDTGVTVIPKIEQTQDFLDKMLAIEEQEDAWFDSIDRLKYSTFETVCLRKYLDD
jgi:4-hydroxy-4-methyl-2-oxoglutarate aldolase